MARSLTAGMLTAVAAETGECTHLIELALSGGTVRYTTASSNLSWSAQTWTALGGALTIGPVSESGDLQAAGVDLSFPGVDTTLWLALLAQNRIGRTAKVWLAHLDATTKAVIADPLLVFSGYINDGASYRESRPTVVGQAGTADITIRCVSRLAALSVARGMQVNMVSHQAHYPGDRFYEFSDIVATRELRWP